MDIAVDEHASLLGASIWGMVRTASLEIDPAMLRLVCVDSYHSRDDTGGFRQLLRELKTTVGSKFLDSEVVYRDNTRFVRRLRKSKHHIVGNEKYKLQKRLFNIGTALITGGLGGLGLVTAELLMNLEAKHIVLVSRSGKAKNYEGQHLEERVEMLLQQGHGACVSIECCDMSNKGEVKSLLERVQEKHGDINTIIHGSGALQDGWLRSMTTHEVRSSFGAKAAGAWYLHQHTANNEIRHFVLFSSIAAIFGNPGQANYLASNSYLDSLVRMRQRMGLPAVSIQWPAIADVGMAAANEKRLRGMASGTLSLPIVRKLIH